MTEFSLNPHSTHDFYAVFQPPKTRKGFSSHLCNVHARDGKHALQIARNHGLSLRKGAHASYLGRAGYAESLMRCGGGTSVS